MNFLAHAFLARHSDDAMRGSLLGDFCKPDEASQFNAETRSEIRMHRKIDAFTDSHPIVLEAKARFGSGTRRFAGIALDVFYDHVLTRTWATYSDVALDIFIADFYRALVAGRETLPERAQVATRYMTRQDWLGSYRDFDGVRIALERIAGRLSRQGDRLVASVDDLAGNYTFFSEGFEAFFPQLQAFVAQERARSAS